MLEIVWRFVVSMGSRIKRYTYLVSAGRQHAKLNSEFLFLNSVLVSQYCYKCKPTIESQLGTYLLSTIHYDYDYD